MTTSEPIQAHAFPARIADAHLDLLRTLAASAFVEANPESTRVTVDEQSVMIPGRLYYSGYRRRLGPGGGYGDWSKCPGGAVIDALVAAARELDPGFGGELRRVLPRTRAHSVCS